jgi:hypothetical protein
MGRHSTQGLEVKYSSKETLSSVEPVLPSLYPVWFPLGAPKADPPDDSRICRSSQILHSPLMISHTGELPPGAKSGAHQRHNRRLGGPGPLPTHGHAVHPPGPVAQGDLPRAR